jgi:Fe-S-cluster containining protein
MGHLFLSYQLLETSIYARIPEIECQACGRCCISPHVTLVELCYMLSAFCERPQELARVIQREVPAHPDFHGQLACRFQSRNGACSIYAHRATPCRLHGHKGLLAAGDQYGTQCHRVRYPNGTLAIDSIHTLLDRLAAVNGPLYDNAYYTAPYWLSALNLECWLTLLFTRPRQALFAHLRRVVLRELGLGDRLQEMAFPQQVPLGPMLDRIDAFHQDLAEGRMAHLPRHLDELCGDDPRLGTYYRFEKRIVPQGAAPR